jgi:GNAT superfamily N-acetyltransferase
MAVTIKLLDADTIPLIASAFFNSEWKTPESHYWNLLAAQVRGERVFLVAFYKGDVAGFVTIKWQSDYPPFAEKGIPEINDLRVLQVFRRRGMATALMDEVEKRIFKRSKEAGLGVGLYADYGAAQQMYIQRGYVPDGRGLMYNNQPVRPGQEVLVDDGLVLFFTKKR